MLRQVRHVCLVISSHTPFPSHSRLTISVDDIELNDHLIHVLVVEHGSSKRSIIHHIAQLTILGELPHQHLVAVAQVRAQEAVDVRFEVLVVEHGVVEVEEIAVVVLAAADGELAAEEGVFGVGLVAVD